MSDHQSHLLGTWIKLLNKEECEKLYNINEVEFYKLHREYKLPMFKSGLDWCVRESDLKEFLKGKKS